MKTLTNIANRERLSTSQDVVWLFEIDWPDATRGYSTRPISLNGLTCKPWIAGLERRTTAPDDSLPTTELPGERVTIRLLNVPADAERLDILARRHDAEGCACRLRLFLRDAAGGAEPADCIEVFWGRIRALRLGTTWAEIEAGDFVREAAHREIGRLLDRTLFPVLPLENVGRMAPWIFGRAVGAPLIPLRDGPTTRLRQPLDPEDWAVRVDSLAGFPAAGLLQVGDELVRYSVVDEPAMAFGDLASPVERSTPSSHETGTQLRLVPEGGFEFLIADHPCRGVSELRADGQWVDPASYAVMTETVGGASLHKAVLALWPTRLIAETGPTRLALAGADTEGQWTAEEESTALSPLAAVDADPLGTSAVVTGSRARLALAFRQNLGQGERRYGPLRSARLNVRHWADRAWASSTQVRVRIRKDGLSTVAVLPRPVSMQTAEVDFTALAAAFGGWGFFTAEGGWPRVEIEMAGLGDLAQLHVVELAWAIDYRPRREARMASRLTATVEGLPSAGALLENPADIIRFLLTDARAAGLAGARLDEASFALARAQLAALGYRFAARLDRRETVERLLAAALFESRTELRRSGDRVRLVLSSAEVERADSVFEFDELVLLEPQVERRRDDSYSVFNDLTILYAPDFSQPAGERHRRSWRERRNVGAASPGERLPHVIGARWLGDVEETAAKDLAAFHLARRSERRWMASVATPLQAIHLDWSDAVALTHGPTGYDAAPGRISGWTMTAPDRLALEIELEAQGPVCWAFDESTFLQPRGANTRLAIFVGGTQAARLESGGALSIAGEVVEQGLESVRLRAAIEYDEESGRLLFGVGANGVYEAGFGFDSGGNLLLRGELAEGQWLEWTPLAACWRATLDSFALGIAGAAPLAVYESDGRKLRLLGEVKEGL